MLTIRPSEGCELDGVSLGETMLRLDPTPVPTPRAKTLGVYQGGGENNVIYGLSACFGMNCSVVTALVPKHTSLYLLNHSIVVSPPSWLGVDSNSACHA